MSLKIYLIKNQPDTATTIPSSRQTRTSGRPSRSATSARRTRSAAFNPFAKSSKEAAIEPDNTEMLHHKCAMKARMCWSLWNRGFPFAFIQDHYPEGRNYTLTLDLDQSDLLEAQDGRPATSQHRATPTELATFLVDLIRLQKTGLHGEFDLALMKTNFSFDRMKYIGHRFVLVPCLDDLIIVHDGPTDLLRLAKRAAKLVLPGKIRSIASCTSIEAILKRIDGLSIRKDNQTTADGELFINLDDQPVSMHLQIGNEVHSITANPHGFLMVSKPISGKVPAGIAVPVRVEPFPTSDKINPWVERALCWQSIPKIWENGVQNESIKNTVGTLAAELRFAENTCYQYKIEEHDMSSGTATVRIERRDKNGNAHDLWESAVRNREMNVALNTDPSVFNWKQEDEWMLEAIHDKDPYLLTVRTLKRKAKLSEKGFLKSASVPQRALMVRKEKLIRRGITLNSFQRIQDNRMHPERPSNWRLTERNSIMALQGPPGTGKTWTACQVLNDLLVENPYARILVSAKEHLALDHLTNRIREALDPSFDVVRICNTENDSIREIDPRATAKVIAEKMLKELSIPNSTMRELGRLATWVDELAMRTASVVCTTTLDKTMESLQQSGVCFDFAIVEEAGKSYPSELIGPLSISRQTLLIGDHLQLPPFELNSISKTVGECFRSGIESWPNRDAKDTIERLLVAQSMSYREREQFSIDQSVQQVEEWLQPFQSIHRSSQGDTLQFQWRMFATLSNAIGKIFYGHPFELRKVNAIDDHNLPGVFGENQNRLLMIDAHSGKEGKHNKSFSNKIEAKLAAKNFLELNQSGAEVIILTPYKGQVAEIKALLPDEHHSRVRTVDGFQGKEADFIILSLVRNNKRTGSARRWGFFRDPRRINVALSRAREGLLLITSMEHVENTDWSENEGQLAAFIDAIAANGRVLKEGEN